MHWCKYNYSTALSYVVKINIIFVCNFNNLNMPVFCLPACLTAVRPSSAKAMASDFHTTKVRLQKCLCSFAMDL